jgi:hypothetical protein
MVVEMGGDFIGGPQSGGGGPMMVRPEEERGVVEVLRRDSFTKVQTIDTGLAEGLDQQVSKQVVIVLQAGGKPYAPGWHLCWAQHENERDLRLGQLIAYE